MHVSIAQANLPKMYLEYSPISCWFFSPHVAFALEAFVHLYAAAKNVLFSTQSNKKSVNLGPCRFLTLAPNTLWKNWKHERIFMEKYGKVTDLCGKCEGFLKKNEKHIWENDEFDWKSDRIYIYGKNMEKWRICMETWRIYKEKWRISMEKWRIRLEKWKNLYGPTVF